MKKVKILVEWVDKMHDSTLSASLSMEPNGQEVLLLLFVVLLVWAGELEDSRLLVEVEEEHHKLKTSQGGTRIPAFSSCSLSYSILHTIYCFVECPS
jgi:hypothetical protein